MICSVLSVSSVDCGGDKRMSLYITVKYSVIESVL